MLEVRFWALKASMPDHFMPPLVWRYILTRLAVYRRFILQGYEVMVYNEYADADDWLIFAFLLMLTLFAIHR